MRRAVALSCRGTERERFPRHVFNVEAGCNKRAVYAGIVPAQPRHDGEPLVGLISILRIKPAGRFAGHGILRQVADKYFAVMIVIERSAHGKVVLLGKFGFVHELCVAVLLKHAIAAIAKGIVGVVPRAMQHEREARVAPVLKEHGVLPLRFVAVGTRRGGIRQHVVRQMGVGGSSSVALVAEQANRELGNEARRNVRPAVHHVVLTHFGHIHKPVFVLVVRRLAGFVMQEQASREAFREMQVGIGICLKLQL